MRKTKRLDLEAQGRLPVEYGLHIVPFPVQYGLHMNFHTPSKAKKGVSTADLVNNPAFASRAELPNLNSHSYVRGFGRRETRTCIYPGQEALEKTERRKEYLFVVEKFRERNMGRYQSVEEYNSVKWGFLTIPPLPKWYDSAREVLTHAIELSPETDSFGLLVDLKERQIDVFPRDPTIVKAIEKVVADYFKIKETGVNNVK